MQYLVKPTPDQLKHFTMKNIKNKLHEIIRVNHAGEFGAKVIYDGQIAALKIKKDQETLDLVQHMKDQEIVHFDYFDAEIRKEKVRPTIMQPLWRVGGFAMGFVTALIDKKAAMTCTTAVEEVIDEHYQEQIRELEKEGEFLEGEEKNKLNLLRKKIQKFREEELEHRDTAYENKAAEARYFKPLSMLIKGVTKFAIATSKKV